MNFIRQRLLFAKIWLYAKWMTSILHYSVVPAWLKDYRMQMISHYRDTGIERNSWILNKLQKNLFY